MEVGRAFERHFNNGWDEQEYWGGGSSYRPQDVGDPPASDGGASSYRPQDVWDTPSSGGGASSYRPQDVEDTPATWKAYLPPKKVKEYLCNSCKDMYKHHDLLQSQRSKWLKCNEDEVKIGQWICYECEA